MLSEVTLFYTWAQAYSLIKQRGIFLCSIVCYTHLSLSIVKLT
jgi:hypothetical protein